MSRRGKDRRNGPTEQHYARAQREVAERDDLLEHERRALIEQRAHELASDDSRRR